MLEAKVMLSLVLQETNIPWKNYKVKYIASLIIWMTWIIIKYHILFSNHNFFSSLVEAKQQVN